MEIQIFTIIVLIISAIFHEYAHGWVAYKLGDSTAKLAGRLTLNPLAHIDPIGSIFFPLLLVLSNAGFVLGWAKPVPYNPYNLNDPKYGDLKVAIGGPGSNFLIAIFFGIVARLIPLAGELKIGLVSAYFQGNYSFLLSQMHGSILASIYVMALIFVLINLLLMLFNLMPVPPLDGSKVLMAFLPLDWKIKFSRIEPYGIFIVIFLLMFGFFSLIYTPLIFLFRILVGV